MKIGFYIYIYIVFIPIPKKGNAKKCSNYCTNALARKVMLKILQARLQQYVKQQAGFRKGRGTRDQMPTFAGSWKKQESSRKTSISALLTMPKPLTVSQVLVGGEGNATHSSVLAWRIPGMAKPGGLPSMGSHKVGHD